MARKSIFDFTANMAGADRVKRMFDTAINATGAILGKQAITKKLLKMNQDRFEPRGSNKRAQKSPDGVPWEALSVATRRRKNTNRAQVLTDTGKLRNAIIIARDGLKSALTAGTGSATLAVRRVQNRQSNKDGTFNVRYTDEYGKYLQEGFVSHWSKKKVKARPFLGIGKQDAKDIEGFMVTTLDKFFVNFS